MALTTFQGIPRGFDGFNNFHKLKLCVDLKQTVSLTLFEGEDNQTIDYKYLGEGFCAL